MLIKDIWLKSGDILYLSNISTVDQLGHRSLYHKHMP